MERKPDFRAYHPSHSNDVNGNAYNTSFILNGPLINDVLGFQLSGGFRHTDESGVAQFGDSTTGDADYKNGNLGTKFTWKVDDKNTVTFGQSHTETSRTRNPGKSLGLRRRRFQRIKTLQKITTF